MPYNRPGRGVYVTNNSGAALTHAQPVRESSFVGIAVKQRQPGFNSVIADYTRIEIAENFFLDTKGVVQVAAVAGFAKGDFVYITPGNVLTETAAGNTPFGQVVEVAGVRGTPVGRVRIDLDLKADLT